MKKLALTIAIVLGIATTTFADPTMGGLFQKGSTPDYERGNRTTDPATPMLPQHGQTDNQDATPVGSGIAVLLGLGAAYLVGKQRREE